MTVVRKLQFNPGLQSYFIVIPKQLIEGMEWGKGKPIRFSIKGKKILMTPDPNNPEKGYSFRDEEITQAVGQGVQK